MDRRKGSWQKIVCNKKQYQRRNCIAPGKTVSVIWEKSRLRIVIVIIYHVRIYIRTYVYANFRTCNFPQLLSQKPSDSCVANCRRWHCPTAEKCKNRQVSFDLYRRQILCNAHPAERASSTIPFFNHCLLPSIW